MANSTSDLVKNEPLAPSCAEAFEALKTYDTGSPRALLAPIDDAVIASLRDGTARARLEAQLAAALQAGGSVVAREYICSKLALIGTSVSAPALAAQLSHPQISTSARNALEAIPGDSAAKALRSALRKTNGLPKVGIVNSLGVRRDAGAVSELEPLLRDQDAQVAAAAMAALGEIGSVKAGRALRVFFSKKPETLRSNAGDAALTCAARLAEQGRKAEAESLLNLLTGPAQPVYVRQAAQRSLK